jgi:hypothetical protein
VQRAGAAPDRESPKLGDGSRLAANFAAGGQDFLLGSVAHLRENLAAEGVTLDDEALRTLDGAAA